MRTFFAISRGMLTAAAVTALGLAGTAQAQYPQYGYPQAQPQYNQAPAQYGQAPAQHTQAPGQYQATPQYNQAGVYQGYPQGTGYVAPYSVPRVAMAYQPQAAAPANENLNLTPPAETVQPGIPQNGYVPQPVPAADPYGTPTYSNGTTSVYGANGAAGCNTCQNGTGYSSYGCDSTAYGACNYGHGGPMSGVLRRGAGCGYWFGGVYGLFMDRDNSNKYSLAFVTDPSMPTAYPPAAMDVVLTTRAADIGFQPGVEFRVGRTFGCSYDPCTCCTTGPKWGVEGVYWTLFEEDEAEMIDNPTGTSRMYTMMPMYGLEYDHGNGYFPVNEYWDHGMPSDPANPIRVTRVRTASTFEVQNIEVNLLRLSVCGGGCGGATYGACAGADACAGGCDSYGYGGGCDTCCAPAKPKHSYSCSAVCGFRWLELDEAFMFGVDYTNPAWGAPSGFLNYWSNVENNLLGAQIGCNGMYRIGCKWGLHLNTLVGVYANDIDVRQYMVSPTGQVRYIGTTENFDVMADKTDVAMLGELRLGASYQATCHCRLYGGWRAIGVTGVALATDQTPAAFLSAAQMSNYVNSNGSMILHGLQTGVEWNY
jgi:hypothetical protein